MAATAPLEDPEAERRAAARAQHALGNRLIDEGQLDRAISAFRRALRLDDSLAEVHNDLGAAYFRKRWYAEAEACFRKAVERDPAHGVAHANRGAALRALGRFGEARRAYQRALWLKLLGVLPRFLRPRPAKPAAPARAARPGEREVKPIRAALEAGDSARAVALARALLARYPDDPDALHLQAMALEEVRDFDAGLRCERRALELVPDRSEYHIQLARLLVGKGELEGALQAANAALKLEPGSAAIHATIAGLLQGWRHDLAEQAARHAIELEPGSHAGHANLAAALWEQGRLEEAERAGREAVRLAPRTLSYRTNLALILKDLGRMDEARTLYHALIAEAPQHAKLCQDVGKLALEVDADLDTARALFRRAQAGAGGARGFLAEGLLDLMLHEFAAAWPNYESRKLLLDQRGHHDQFAAFPDWDGTVPPPGKLLVYGEQGLGDEIMFASMLPELAREVRELVVLCDPRLAALFQRSFPALEVVGEPRPTQRQRIAAHPGIGGKIAAGSLGARYRRRLADFPAQPGYLAADPAKVEAWRARLGGEGLRIGLSWVGGVQRTGRGRRSIALAALAPLVTLPGTRWVSLQYTGGQEEIRDLEAATGGTLLDASSATQDMDELAGLVGALDLVVSVCNSTVHLAGALGKPVLVMAPFVPEWRYGIAGERMPWYPSARVFRQAAYGDWSGVIARVKEAVAHRLTGEPTR